MRMIFAKFNSILSCDSRELKKNTPLFISLIFTIYISHDIKLPCFKLSSNGLSGSRKKSQNVKNLQTERRTDARKKICDKKG